MGPDTIQSATSATVLDHPTVLGPTPQQTALPGYDAKSAPPSGFRQRIAQAFVQFGRKLSSLVSAPSPGYPRHPNSESLGRSTRKQLVSLLKLVHSGHLDQTKLSVALDALGHEKQQWLQSDPARAEQQFADMVRGVLDQHWPGGKALDLEKSLAATTGPNFASLPQGDLREQLTTLVSAGAGEQRAAEALKARHKDEIRRMGFAEAKKMAESVFWKGPVLSAALKAFDKAEKACEYKAGATEETLQAARDALEDAGDHLLEALEATHPNKAGKALARRLSAYQNFSTLYIKARNQAQANLYSEFADDYFELSRDSAAVVQKSAQAKALRARVAQDGPPRQRGAPRGPEEQYFLKLRKQGDYLQQVSALQAPDDDPDMREVRESLDRLPTLISGREKASTGAAADYAEALQMLNQAIAAADRKVAILVAETSEKIEKLGEESATPERASNAQKLIMGTNSAVLKKLPANAQIRLMNLMRGDLKRQPPPTKQRQPFLDAQSKLYQAMGLRPELLAHEKELRRNVMNELRKDKNMLQEVRDLWHTYTLSEKRHIMMRIARVHSSVLGCEPPRDIVFDPNPALRGCLWQPDSRMIVVGTASGKQMDFEQVMNSLFHENTHNWQDHLARNLTGADSAQHPLHDQALIFKGNKPFYVSSSSGYATYRLQPVEVHAYRSGRRLAADLMRMLAS